MAFYDLPRVKSYLTPLIELQKILNNTPIKRQLFTGSAIELEVWATLEFF